ncbi:hypothetical protein V6N12_001203 [Hibiscus sabdariffa]|uniref:Pectinesterase inhibitor domain-containing protein n=2 Tax=Hibiscus sabdariffa TaxID=183260 RepID=A0ABR2C846_9ROSI
MKPIMNKVALPLSFFLCLSFFPSLNATPDISETCQNVRHKDLCISSFESSHIARYIPSNAKPKVIASIIIKITVSNASDVSRNLKSAVLEGSGSLKPEVREKYGICDREVASAMKELDKVRTTMAISSRKSEDLNMKAAIAKTEKCEEELKQVEALLPDKKQVEEVVVLKQLLENIDDIIKAMD